MPVMDKEEESWIAEMEEEEAAQAAATERAGSCGTGNRKWVRDCTGEGDNRQEVDTPLSDCKSVMSTVL
jgi:hypothetical protein